MKKALAEARKALAKQEVPIGAIIVDSNDKIIARGHNLVEKKNSQLGHAEIIAIEKACKKIGDWRLNNCYLYVTLEPCTMCMGLIKLTRIKKVVFAAKSPKFGYQLDNNTTLSLYKKRVVGNLEGLCSEEAIDLLKSFFRVRRKTKEA